MSHDMMIDEEFNFGQTWDRSSPDPLTPEQEKV
jgi:hypothetical protein